MGQIISKLVNPKQYASDAKIQKKSILIETRKLSPKHQANALIKWKLKA